MSRRQVVENCWPLDVYTLRKAGVLDPEFAEVRATLSFGEQFKIGVHFSRFPEPIIRVRYKSDYCPTDEPYDCDYAIKLTTTACHFGGYRYWFVCPRWGCGWWCRRRVAKLWLPPGGDFFWCRQCYDLTHYSAQTHDDRVNKLAQNPSQMAAYMFSGDTTLMLLGWKAYDWACERGEAL